MSKEGDGLTLIFHRNNETVRFFAPMNEGIPITRALENITAQVEVFITTRNKEFNHVKN